MPSWTDNIGGLGFLILYQRSLAEKWQLNIKGGLGLGNSYIYRQSNGKNYSEGPALNYKAGASVQYFFRHDAFLETSLNFSFIEANYMRVYAQPGVSIGWQFNRNTGTGLRWSGVDFWHFLAGSKAEKEEE
jgi:hypothetical protein